MRIWSPHPRYLDRQGLTACWRETLLAQAVLAGLTKGYTKHPQLERFRATADPMAAIGTYLDAIADEAEVRGYRYDRTRIRPHAEPSALIPVTTGRLQLEWGHLAAKLAVRSPALGARWSVVTEPDTHPLFVEVPGPVEPWERNPS